MESNLLIRNELDTIKRMTPSGAEYWTGRDLQPILEYALWQNFESVIKKARMACESAGAEPDHHFIETNNKIKGGKGAKLSRADWTLSRYACYLVAMNGNPSKPAIAIAQSYFAVQTRRQEVQDQLAAQQKRLLLRQRVTNASKALNSAAQGAGVQNYAFFHDAGYQGLYGGKGVKQIKQIKGIPDRDALLDCVGRAELAANEFRITQAEDKLRRENTRGQSAAEDTHRYVGRTVRDSIQQLGGTMPEDLPREPSIKKLLAAKKKPKKLPSET